MGLGAGNVDHYGFRAEHVGRPLVVVRAYRVTRGTH